MTGQNNSRGEILRAVMVFVIACAFYGVIHFEGYITHVLHAWIYRDVLFGFGVMLSYILAVYVNERKNARDEQPASSTDRRECKNESRLVRALNASTREIIAVGLLLIFGAISIFIVAYACIGGLDIDTSVKLAQAFITPIITLLSSIIGYYFGIKSNTPVSAKTSELRPPNSDTGG